MKTRRAPKTRTPGRQNPRRQRLDPIAHDWTDAQAIAVYDLCATLQEMVWRRYEQVLIDAALGEQLQLQAASNADDRTYGLPFEDEDMPF